MNRPDTVVLGLGLATLVPDNGITAMNVADVDGVKVAGLLIDAGSTNSALLMRSAPRARPPGTPPTRPRCTTSSSASAARASAGPPRAW
ncbi:hypothetical protein ACFH04_41955 [Streptomyces noboritoensis]|uniref:Uncharacterized protein n=1 Tax=Streptomyces noboritoensis TaxID=67337 RepID=A0ABV6TWT6_9ACTN